MPDLRESGWATLLFPLAQILAILLGAAAGIIGTLGDYRNERGELTPWGRRAIIVVLVASVFSGIAVILEAMNDAAAQRTLAMEIRRGLLPLTRQSVRASIDVEFVVPQPWRPSPSARDFLGTSSLSLTVEPPETVGNSLPSTYFMSLVFRTDTAEWRPRGTTDERLAGFGLEDVVPDRFHAEPSLLSYADLAGKGVCANSWVPRPIGTAKPAPAWRITRAALVIDGRRINLDADNVIRPAATTEFTVLDITMTCWLIPTNLTVGQ